MLDIVSIVDEGLGHSSHLMGLGDGTAVVIDPARFPRRQQQIASERSWRIAWTVDTHTHADYISGSPELAAEGATFLASAAAGLEVAHRGVHAGDEIELGADIAVRAIATPGHTPDHLAYLVLDGGVPVALFSGGSLMVGTVGRTDLLGDERSDELARELYRSLRDEILTLPDQLPVYPTHGAGSFCATPGGSTRTTTIGQEKLTNSLLRLDDEDQFVHELVSGLGTFPPYFGELPERNRRGPRLYRELPTLPRLDVDACRRQVADGTVLVDARPIEAFAEGHPAGAISIAARPVFGSWLGWLVDLDRPVIFVFDDDTDRDDVVRQSLTIGHDAILGELAGGIEAWRAAGLPTAAIEIVRPDEVSGTVLDVRQRAEWDDGHVPHAMHIELGSLTDAGVPDGPITVMCGHGERAMSGASMLARRGRRDLAVLGGGPDEWSTAAGRSLVRCR